MKTAPGIRIQHVDQMVLDTYVDLIHYLEAQFHSLGAVRRPRKYHPAPTPIIFSDRQQAADCARRGVIVAGAGAKMPCPMPPNCVTF